MNILIAPDKFKGTLESREVASAIAKGIKKKMPGSRIMIFPMADGGEGTVDALVRATRGRIIEHEVTGPLGEKTAAFFGLISPSPLQGFSTAVIEMSAASGLHLVPPKARNPLHTTTYGTGELIKAVLDYDPGRIIVGIGGSATVDGGMGAAQALGVRFYADNDTELGRGGQELERINRIDTSCLDPRVKRTKILVASDVSNPLYGPSGAAYVYGPQKGATPDMVKRLDKGLRNYAHVIKRDLKKDISKVAGAGAAGGLGAGLIAFFGAKLEAGVGLVIKATNIADKIREADLVITGEGRIDAQTAFGKVPVGVAGIAKQEGIPVYAVCGQKSNGAVTVYKLGIDRIFVLSDIAGSIKAACEKPAAYLEEAGEIIASQLNLTR